VSCSHLQLQSWCSWILCTALTVPRQVQASHLFAATPSYDEVVSRLCLQRQVADPQLADVRHTCVAVGENVLSAQPLESIKWTNCEGIPEAECSKTPDCVWCKSAAVGANCYNKVEAKHLPPAIFDCGSTRNGN